uniref:rRNA-processing protein FYV7 n=1 Tax=Attheya septentrionalis TaxID=420275 RepID=A0A7S2XKT6_9STRA|mmetsp:Transcript_17867/g.32346  ORF Transcript_17867/g.32346 Transcript_17867/m.32346 type:complete len:196 (+) Transcript_17867:212-799(+)
MSSSGTSNHANPNSNRRLAVTVTQFAATPKGSIRQLHKFRDKKQKEGQHRAKLLRGYQKVMKKEGYEAGTGASRKRRDPTSTRREEQDDDDDDDNKDPKKESRPEDEESAPTGKRRKKMVKSDPFAKARQKAQEAKEGRQKAQEGRAQRDVEVAQKLVARKKRGKLLRQRTKRGQPVMKNVITDMLQQIQKTTKP